MPASNPVVDPKGVDPWGYGQAGRVRHVGCPEQHGELTQSHFNEAINPNATAARYLSDEFVRRTSIDISIPYRNA